MDAAEGESDGSGSCGCCCVGRGGWWWKWEGEDGTALRLSKEGSLLPLTIMSRDGAATCWVSSWPP